MKKRLLLPGILVAGLMFIGFSGNQVYGQTPQTKSVKTTTKYTCPMHAEIVQDTTGSCSKCGMTLVEKKDTPKGNVIQAKDSTIKKKDLHKMLQDSSTAKAKPLNRDLIFVNNDKKRI